MPLAHCDFHPKSRKLVDLEELGEDVSWYGELLYRNGQIDREYQVHNIHRSWRLTVSLHGRMAHRPRYHSGYATKHLKELRPKLQQPPVWTVEAGGPLTRKFVSWRKAPSLILQAPWFDSLDAPLLHGHRGEPVAVFGLPVNDDQRELITRNFHRHWEYFSMWLPSGVLEIPAYKAIVDVHGELVDSWRRLGAILEHATGIPVYVEVFRHYSHGEKERARRCPGCGRKWFRKSDGPGLACFDCRCDRCRLVQLPGCAEEGKRLARIGDWRPGKALVPARKLVRDVAQGKIRW